MKKICVLGLLALCGIALSQQEASAWVNSRFAVGLNWDYQSGGNQIAWGLWRNQQPGNCDNFGRHHKQGGAPMYMPAPVPVAVPPVKMIVPAPGVAVPAPTQTYMIPQTGPALVPHGYHAPQQPTYAVPATYMSPYQFATQPRPVYYYYYIPQ